jgi:hypothetical protein
MGVPQQSSSQQ